MVVGKAESLTTSGLVRFWRNFTATDDALQKAANGLALFIASSQPLYPLGVVWIIGDPGWACALSWVTTPMFLATPFVGHASPVLGRLLVAFAGSLVTLLVTLQLGLGSWVEAYYVPALLVGACLFRCGEGRARALALALPLAAFVTGRLGAGADLPEVGRLWLVHLGGALGLSAYLLLLFWRAGRPSVTLQAPADWAKQ